MVMKSHLPPILILSPFQYLLGQARGAPSARMYSKPGPNVYCCLQMLNSGGVSVTHDLIWGELLP